jgi:hypothetical protein
VEVTAGAEAIVEVDSDLAEVSLEAGVIDHHHMEVLWEAQEEDQWVAQAEEVLMVEAQEAEVQADTVEALDK